MERPSHPGRMDRPRDQGRYEPTRRPDRERMDRPRARERSPDRREGKGAGGPYKLQLTRADLILSDKDGVSVWSSGANGQKNQLALRDDGVVILRRRDGQSAWQAGEPQTC